MPNEEVSEWNQAPALVVRRLIIHHIAAHPNRFALIIRRKARPPPYKCPTSAHVTGTDSFVDTNRVDCYSVTYVMLHV